MSGIEFNRSEVDTSPSTPTEIVPEEETMQARFERLLAQARGEQQPVEEQTASFDEPGLGHIEEKVFAEFDPLGRPKMGIRWTHSNGDLTYSTNMFQGNPADIGPIMVVETHIDVQTEGRHISGGDYGQVSALLSEKADQSMVQASANVVNVPVLHSVDRVDVADKARITGLTGRGYTRRTGYPTVYDRIYTPQKRG